MSPDPLDRVKAFFGEDDPPRRLGRFEIVREIARGGMSVVYEARDPSLGRSVALKVLKDGSPERLRREAEAAARLRHPNVVAVHEVGDGWIAMDLLRGRTLAEVAVGERLEALETVARAVAHAHAEGVVHRDLKPGNVMVEPDGRVVLTDFGLARIEGGEDLTRTGAVIGTPHYMAPEQVQGRGASKASDVWALGVMLHEELSRTRPFDGATALSLYDAIVRSDPAVLPGDLGAVAAKALEKDPARRYPDAGAFAEDLARARRGEPVSAKPAGPLSRLMRSVRRRPAPVAVGLTALVAAALVLWSRGREAEALREQARTTLEAALELRRAGAIAQMRKLLPPFEEACRRSGTAEADHLLGRFHRALLEDAKALECQERALAKDPSYAPARYERAVLVALRDGRPALDEAGSAREGWREAVKRDAVGPGPVARGLAAYAGGDLGAARAAFEEALRADPLLEEARELLALVIRSELQPTFEERERRYRQEEELFAQGLARDRGYLPHWLGRGEMRWMRGSRRRHRGLDPTPDYAAAEEDFAEAARLDPGSARARQWRGEVRVYQGIWKIENDQDPRPLLASAEEDLAKAIELDPRDPLGWLWRGNARFYRGVWAAGKGLDALSDFDLAERDLAEAVARSAASSVVERRWRGRMRAQRGAALGRRGQDAGPVFAAAEEDFAAIEAGSLRDAWFWMWRSTVWSERGLWKRSRGEDPEADFAKAEEQAGRAVQIDRGQMECWKHRGFARWLRAVHREASGDAAGARESYAAAAADFLEALSINPTLRHQIGDRAETARRKSQ
jgi:tetratricopeptide (TPR) repeat protein